VRDQNNKNKACPHCKQAQVTVRFGEGAYRYRGTFTI